ncbi:MAG: carboxylating nicotinate-nucleotide diphosphorylase, partial [Chloroflexota bacterium]|nr:carboxylating nicotinate-nucleotide diphosphorylase [Chloroflexota bacterium]
MKKANFDGLPLPVELQHPSVLNLLNLALAEDLSPDADLVKITADIFMGDVTSSATLRADSRLEGHIRSKADGVVAGLPVAAAVFALVEAEIAFEPRKNDGQLVAAGDVLAAISGPGPAMLAGERVALNFLGRLSGVATLTRKFVDAVAGTGAVILDTRKTAPGARLLDKYAVRMGGGQNHRMGLYDMVLIKDNHIDGAGGISAAIQRVRQKYGHQYPIEVETKTLLELKEALALEPTRIMLDNMSLETMRRAVEISAGR